MSTRDISWGKVGRCVGLTSLPLSYADCLEIWEPQPPGNLRACSLLYRDCLLQRHNFSTSQNIEGMCVSVTLQRSDSWQRAVQMSRNKRQWAHFQQQIHLAQSVCRCWYSTADRHCWQTSLSVLTALRLVALPSADTVARIV